MFLALEPSICRCAEKPKSKKKDERDVELFYVNVMKLVQFFEPWTTLLQCVPKKATILKIVMIIL